MVISKKAEQVISKGGEVKADKKGWSHFSLRIQQETLQEIEVELDKGVGQSKTNWILQAIQEKLRRKNEQG